MSSLVVTLAALLALEPTVAPARDQGVPIGKGADTPSVELTAPRGGWTLGRMLLVEGSVSDPTVDPIVLSINGDRYLVRTQNGRFRRSFPAGSGRNVVVAVATNRGGTATAQATSYANIPSVPLKTVLTSDMDGVYTDLHIYEPTKTGTTADGGYDLEKMAHVYWANTESPSGGTFFLNEQGGDFDQPGYGPYLYVHRAPPVGAFLIVTNYWPSGDKSHTRATLNITLFEGTPREVKRLVAVPLATPGTTRALAWIRFSSATEAEIYVPGIDPRPKNDGWPKNLAEVTKQAEGGS
ncbi:MAG: DUF2135 domain-containing protein [Deltaproteobacteria bacterium]|nr:DUF2135 domain-containing protein [Deltaproteobacteria bacterium]